MLRPCAELARQLRGDLDEILLKAIDLDPAQRYASADAFARDLERYLADEPPQAVHRAPEHGVPCRSAIRWASPSPRSLFARWWPPPARRCGMHAQPTRPARSPNSMPGKSPGRPAACRPKSTTRSEKRPLPRAPIRRQRRRLTWSSWPMCGALPATCKAPSRRRRCRSVSPKNRCRRAPDDPRWRRQLNTARRPPRHHPGRTRPDCRRAG